MKEKTADIDILEEDVKNILNCCTDIETLISLDERAKEDLKNNTHNIQQQEVLTIIREFIRCKNDCSNLIAENKELKEEKDSLKKEVIHWKGEYHLENRKYLDLYNKKVSIPTINATEEMLEQYVEKVKIIKEIQELKNMKVDGEIFKTAVNYAIKILQSLLGKE